MTSTLGWLSVVPSFTLTVPIGASLVKERRRGKMPKVAFVGSHMSV